MRKIGKLLPGAIVLMFLSFCVGIYFGGGGTGKIHVPSWSEPVQSQTQEAAVPVRDIPVQTELSGESTAGLPETHRAAEGKLNLNTADYAQLQTLPGIGPVRARSILDYREQNGPFRSLSDLLQVKGIGPGILENIRDLIDLEDSYEDSDH